MKSSMWGALSATALVLGISALTPGKDVQAGIAQQPLTIGTRVKPNLMLVIDNSGSMDGEGLYPTNDGALWWDTGNRGFWGSSSGRGGGAGLNFNNVGDANSTWKKYVYLFPVEPRIYADADNDHFAVPPTLEFAFARSPDYNGQYYNPAVTYAPWPSEGATTFAAATPAAVKTDPLGTTTINVTGNVTHSFRLHPGMHKPDGTAMRTNELTNNNDVVGRNYDFTYKVATYYSRRTEASAYTVGGNNYNCSTPAPAAYAAFFSNPGSASFSNGVVALAPDGYCLTRTEIASGTPEMQNFANWFQYHRKRHLALRAGMGEAFNDISGIRLGGTPINNRPNNVTMYDFDTQRSSVYDWFYGIGGNNGGTPNREGLKFAGDQFDSTSTGIVQHACQKNFVLQFTDGFSTPSTSSGVGNADNNKGTPYQDAYSNTIADIAMKYYTRIRTDLASGQVPVPVGCRAANRDPQLDCNSNPHVNHYGITLGAQGNIFGVTHQRVADAYTAAPAWVDPTAQRSPVQVDDLYHASVNGRGEMLNARSSTELTNRLRQALESIISNSEGSGSRTASSSTRAGGGSLLFQAHFDASQWTGELAAHEIQTGGTVSSTPRWSAAGSIPAHGVRNIYFRNASGQRTSFAWDQLTTAQQASFNLNPANTSQSDGAGQRRVAWIRGDRSVQGVPTPGTVRLRERASSLGDIVNSSPRYVGTDNFGYDRLPSGADGRDSYQAFRFGKADRTAMVYIGANDGMLHAFRASDGVEQWAFIPSEFMAAGLGQSPALAQLPRSDYTHRYYVDGQPVAGDAYFGNAWHTVLVTTMGAGGRSIVAIDVSNPTAATAPEVLWEFTHPDLGYVMGQPSIQRMANGRWAAIFGSGYGLNKSAKLFIVDIETGELMTGPANARAPIDTDPDYNPASNPANGLSPPYPVDTNGDSVIDMIYAGDLMGNLWRFDVDSSSTNNWRVHHGQANDPRPLVTVCASGNVNNIYACPAASRQPITVRPVVGRGPYAAGQTIYFGTGKFFEDGDNSLTAGATGPVQSFYAIYDDNANNRAVVAGRSELLQQTIQNEVTLPNVGSYRVTSRNALTTSHKGWYVDLIYSAAGFLGERVVADPVLQGGRIIFTTLMPGDACSGGSDGWLMELQARDGGRFDSPILDINGDGLFTVSTPGNQGDTITHNNQQVPASGVKSTVGGLQTPSIINVPGQGLQKKIMSGATGNIQEVGERDTLPRGRTSWRQFWP
ncbi:pilus assembly protein [Lysobacter niastensis]|uniref:PilY1 beta-propeller domain-containing protein n=1 Tax=Lysobacter niastensis TaxID=380629 RepID=A0ABS0B713_9GAMM|nr:PilC/PilY family type IV pilus protein [Lysobacter niastensis]MBF6024698.1 hypothetical protein [Lysobacter niastensis]